MFISIIRNKLEMLGLIPTLYLLIYYKWNVFIHFTYLVGFKANWFWLCLVSPITCNHLNDIAIPKVNLSGYWWLRWWIIFKNLQNSSQIHDIQEPVLVLLLKLTKVYCYRYISSTRSAFASFRGKYVYLYIAI